MRTSNRLNWAAIVAEALAVTASILLAFAIDASWDERQIRQSEQQVLLGLRQEFEAVREVLLSHREQHLQRLAVIETVRPALGNDAVGADGALLDELLAGLLAPTTTDLGNGTLDALLSSGRLEIISNGELRSKLAGWQRVIGEVWDDQELNAKTVFEINLPYVIGESVPVGGVMRTWYPASATSIRSLSEDAAAARKLQQDPRFRVLVELWFGYKWHLTEEFDNAIAAADDILAGIETSLD